MRSDSETANNAGFDPDGAGAPVTRVKPSGSDLAASVPPRHREAGRLVLTAARIESETLARPGDPLRAIDLNTAARMRQRTQADAPGYMAEVGTGGELIPASIMGENSRALELADTVRDPNYITVDASRDRLELANEAGALETALDAAESIGAGNSLEKMLAHQLTAAHRSAMKMSAEMNRRVEYLAHVRGEEQERANIQATRLASERAYDVDISAGASHPATAANGRPAGRHGSACAGERGRASRRCGHRRTGLSEGEDAGRRR